MKPLKMTILPITFIAMMVSGAALASSFDETDTPILLAQNQTSSEESGPSSAEDMEQKGTPAYDTVSNSPETDHNDVGGQPRGTSIEGSENIDVEDGDNNAAMGSTSSVGDRDLVDEDKDENITE